MRLLASLLFIICFIVGCTAESSTNKKAKPTTISLTPVELFQGTGEKFKPFLGPMSGAFKLRYTGNKPDVNLDIELWEKGEKISSTGIIYDLFFTNDEPAASDEIEVIISMDAVSVQNEETFKQLKINLVHESKNGFFAFTTPWDEKLGPQGLIHYSEPTTFDSSESMHVFGLHATSTNSIHTADFSPESLNRMEKAIIFTLHFQ